MSTPPPAVLELSPEPPSRHAPQPPAGGDATPPTTPQRASGAAETLQLRTLEAREKRLDERERQLDAEKRRLVHWARELRSYERLLAEKEAALWQSEQALEREAIDRAAALRPKVKAAEAPARAAPQHAVRFDVEPIDVSWEDRVEAAVRETQQPALGPVAL